LLSQAQRVKIFRKYQNFRSGRKDVCRAPQAVVETIDVALRYNTFHPVDGFDKYGANRVVDEGTCDYPAPMRKIAEDSTDIKKFQNMHIIRLV
jgi:hypothetical protein